MRRYVLELELLYSKVFEEETPWPAMSRGRNYMINENDMKVILNAIH